MHLTFLKIRNSVIYINKLIILLPLGLFEISQDTVRFLCTEYYDSHREGDNTVGTEIKQTYSKTIII